MSYATSGGADQGRTSLNIHQLDITFYKSKTDKGHKREGLTLPQLEDRMHATAARSKDKLPLLKLAQFGEIKNENGTLRHGGNMGDITGIEVDYDGEVIPFDDAIEKMTHANLRCLLYTSPSHTAAAPRWRVLLPVSKPLHKKERTHLVERVNGIFNGALAAESFFDAQTYYYGFTEPDNFETLLLDGDFIDKRQDLEPMAKAAGTPRGATGDRVDDFSTFTIPQLIEHLIKRSVLKDKRELQWHWPMVHLTAKLAAAGSGEAEMIAALSVFCDGGASDPQLLDMVASARRKFAPKPAINAEVLRAALGKVAPDAPPPVLLRPDRPANNAELSDKVEWLLDCYGFSTVGKCVVDLYEPSEECRLDMKHWKEGYAAWREVEEGPRGGKIVHRATDAWSVNTRRTMLRGVRMAPDQAFPLFEDNGLVYKNTYQRPRHEGTGEVDTFHDFMRHLIPNERERDWFWQWLAHKHQHPEVPGVGIVFMAKNVFGCGRGILFGVARKLFGERYVRQEDFEIVAGDSSQGAFTDWVANYVLVCCDETQASPTAHRRGHKLSQYEKFKKVVDPANRVRTLRGKNIAAYEAHVYASFWLATNHGDPFVIPDNDRRIAVLTNGVPLPIELRERILSWREQPGNIARLVRELEAEDLSTFDAQEPIKTAGKVAMIESGYNAAEEALFDIRDAVDAKSQPMYGPAFSREQIKAALMCRQGLVEWQIDAAIRDHTVVVPTATGLGRRTSGTGPKVRIRCFPEKSAFAQRMTDEAIRGSLKQWDTPMGGYRPVSVVPRTSDDGGTGPVEPE